MKKIVFLLPALLSITANAQNNSFPTPSGNTSIGAPGGVATAKIHVLENTALPNSVNASQVISRIGCNSGTGATPVNNFYNNVWLVRSETNSADWWTAKLHDAISLDAGFLTPGTDTKTYWERHPFADRQTWGSGNIPYMSLLAGRLGIGVYNNISARLDIEETNNSFSTLIARNLHTTGGGYCILSNVKQDLTKAFAVANTSIGWAENFVVYGSGQTVIRPVTTQDALLVNDVSNVTKFKVENWGQTTIGGGTMTGPHSAAMLLVNGKMVAKEIIVTTQNWADFVFDSDYSLKPLKQVEQFYKENHHLPDVPSTAEITETGNDLAKTDAILLQKIEELTLYIVELNKKVEQLEKQNSILKKNQ